MQKLILFVAAIIISGISIAATPDKADIYESEYFAAGKKRDTLKNDTMFYARRMSNEIKFTLNQKGEIGLLFNENPAITIKSDGSTGFGTQNPEYRIDVCGSIRASEELIVETNKWCDYVFEDEYKLQPFAERMSVIKKEKHLPYVKAEEDIYNSGVPVSETLSGMLRNIEELYLYVEELENRIKLLEEENKALKPE